MRVEKRSGRMEPVSFDKILRRMTSLATNLSPKLMISPEEMAKQIIVEIMDGIKTSQLDVLGAEAAYALYTTHPDYGMLAARIMVSAMHKDHRAVFAPVTEDEKRAKKKRGTFAAVVERIHQIGLAKGRGVFREEFLANVRKHGAAYEAMLDHSADYNFTYMALRTLKKGYLLTRDDVSELPQHMWMRVAVGLHGSNLDAVKETYELLRDKKNIYGTPTLYNMGMTIQQLSSCFLTGIHKDSIKGIYKALARCADISKTAGGIGLHIHNIRNVGSDICGTGGTSSGLVPMLRPFNETARYVDQGGGKRPGSIAVYAEPHNAEIFEYLDLRKNTGMEERRCRDLFYGLWISDLFMKRVESDAQWSLFCPKTAPGLSDVHGAKFEALYERYEAEGRSVRTIEARKVWYAIIESQIETGTPYMLYKDACNAKSNQKNLGAIKCSNLCTEIVEYTSKDETAVCNLSSICLPSYVEDVKGEDGMVQPAFDFEALHRATKIVAKNLSRVIDINTYPVVSAGRSNRRHRPIGMGVQGLDDVYKRFGFPFGSPESNDLNVAIFETIYHAGVEAATELAEERREDMLTLRQAHDGGEWDFGPLKKLPLEEPDDVPEDDPDYLYTYQVPGPRLPMMGKGRRGHLVDLLERVRPIPEEMKLPDKWAGAYSSYAGSPMSEGVLQQDMWEDPKTCGLWDWEKLKQRCRDVGSRMSLLVAPMPTASTAQIEGNNEAFEPRTSNMYVRRVNAGEFVVMNEVLVRDLIVRGHWSEKMKNSIIANNGSVQHLPDDVLSPEAKRLHLTAWEMSMMRLIDQAADRAAYIDQSMSMNLWQAEPTFASMSAMHFYAWRKRLKTGMYYLRTRALAQAQQVTVPVEEANGNAKKLSDGEVAAKVCSIRNREACEACSA